MDMKNSCLLSEKVGILPVPTKIKTVPIIVAHL